MATAAVLRSSDAAAANAALAKRGRWRAPNDQSVVPPDRRARPASADKDRDKDKPAVPLSAEALAAFHARQVRCHNNNNNHWFSVGDSPN
jgi:hypothetical protein